MTITLYALPLLENLLKIGLSILRELENSDIHVGILLAKSQ